jgi:hypothetical protein
MNQELKSSSDVWFTAFLMDKGEKIKRYEVIARGRVKCFFDLTDDQWRDYKLEFNNSDVVRFKALIEQIKDLAF